MTAFVVTLTLGGIAGAAVLAYVLLPMFTGAGAAGARRVRTAVVLESSDDGARARDRKSVV